MSTARMSTNIEIPMINYGDSSQLINWILESGATCSGFYTELIGGNR